MLYLQTIVGVFDSALYVSRESLVNLVSVGRYVTVVESHISRSRHMIAGWWSNSLFVDRLQLYDNETCGHVTMVIEFCGCQNLIRTILKS